MIILGIAILSVGVFASLQSLNIPPYEFLSCTSLQGGGRWCGGDLYSVFINPIAYQVAVIISTAGAVLFFLGLFGRGFLGPFFILGIFIFASQFSESFEAALIIGGGLIAANAFSWYSGVWPAYTEHRITRRVTARIIGIVLTVDGAILVLFGWVTFPAFGTFVVTESIFWAQVAIGLLLLPLGLWLVGRSLKVHTWGTLLRAPPSESNIKFQVKYSPA
jgi:hypothetical protein